MKNQPLKIGEIDNKLSSNKSLFFYFMIAGIANTIFGYSVFALGIFIGFKYWLALLLSTVLGILFNFKTIGTFVFKSKDNSKFFKFLLVYAALYGASFLLVKLFMKLGLSAYVSGFLALFPVAVLSFFLNKILVFHVDSK